VKPRSFDYMRAKTLPEVFAALEEHGENAVILAGGQSLMPVLNMRLSEAGMLIDINHLPGHGDIEEEQGRIRVGALARHEQVRRSPLIARHAPLLVQALAHVAHPAIRNRGTFGGSLCNADPASELPACALALDAIMEIESVAGKRQVRADDFFLGLYETSLKPGEVLCAVSFPVRARGEMHFFDEIARRRGDYALAGLAAVAHIEGGRLHSARFAFHSCGDRPLLAHALSELVEGSVSGTLDGDAVDKALVNDLDPPSDPVTSSETRAHLAGVLARRAIARFHAGANE
jgi:carbon-monoxide dehydrogenase medium subunit